MTKKAYIVWVTVGTRVVVEEDTSWEDIYKQAIPRLKQNIQDNGYEICETIYEDTEQPYDPNTDL